MHAMEDELECCVPLQCLVVENSNNTQKIGKQLIITLDW